MPIKKEVKALLDVQRSNFAKIKTLLGSPVQVTTKANVASSKYVVYTDIRNQHGRSKYEFTANGKDYTYFYSVYGSDLPKLENGRSTGRAGYSDTVVYAVNAKTSAEILSLFESNIDVQEKAMKVAQRFYKSEKINSVK